jgi:hypothetical protein
VQTVLAWLRETVVIVDYPEVVMRDRRVKVRPIGGPDILFRALSMLSWLLNQLRGAWDALCKVACPWV